MHTTPATRLRVPLQILWRVALFLLVFALVGGLFVLPLAPVLSRWSDAYPTRAQLGFDVAGAAAILISTWLMTHFVDRRPFGTVGLASRNAAKALAGGLAVGIGWIALSVGVLWAAGWATPEVPVALNGSLLLVAATSVFFNVLTQQLLLCGYVFQTIRSRSGSYIAVLASAALFAAYHAGAFQGGWLPVANVFAAGMLFCLAYGATNSLWFPVAIHFAWNLLLGPVLGLTVSGTGQLGLGWRVFAVEGPALFTGGAFGLEGGLVVTLTTTPVMVAMVLFLRGRRNGKAPHPGGS
jgi:CAAX protease family protein